MLTMILAETIIYKHLDLFNHEIGLLKDGGLDCFSTGWSFRRWSVAENLFHAPRIPRRTQGAPCQRSIVRQNETPRTKACFLTKPWHETKCDKLRFSSPKKVCPAPSKCPAEQTLQRSWGTETHQALTTQSMCFCIQMDLRTHKTEDAHPLL